MATTFTYQQRDATMTSTVEIAAYYDGFGRRLIRDYVFGNERVTSAINRVCGVIRDSHINILDVGCGIGTSSYGYKQRHPSLDVYGVDISPASISIARSLFGGPGIDFAVSAMESPPTESTFSVVAMVDVYEHIPRDQWSSFNKTIADCLTPDGILIMTTPSPLHQAYLSQHNPAALQIVDECVELDDIVRLSRDVGGTLTCLKYVNIWNSNDYLHIVIDRAPQYIPNTTPTRSIWQRLRSRFPIKRGQVRRSRKKHVKRVLGIDVT